MTESFEPLRSNTSHRSSPYQVASSGSPGTDSLAKSSAPTAHPPELPSSSVAGPDTFFAPIALKAPPPEPPSSSVAGPDTFFVTGRRLATNSAPKAPPPELPALPSSSVAGPDAFFVTGRDVDSPMPGLSLWERPVAHSIGGRRRQSLPRPVMAPAPAPAPAALLAPHFKRVCSNCGDVKQHVVKQCAGCKAGRRLLRVQPQSVARYCDVACQTRHWPFHKVACWSRRASALRRRIELEDEPPPLLGPEADSDPEPQEIEVQGTYLQAALAQLGEDDFA